MSQQSKFDFFLGAEVGEEAALGHAHLFGQTAEGDSSQPFLTQ